MYSAQCSSSITSISKKVCAVLSVRDNPLAASCPQQLMLESSPWPAILSFENSNFFYCIYFKIPVSILGRVICKKVVHPESTDVLNL